MNAPKKTKPKINNISYSFEEQQKNTFLIEFFHQKKQFILLLWTSFSAMKTLQFTAMNPLEISTIIPFFPFSSPWFRIKLFVLKFKKKEKEYVCMYAACLRRTIHFRSSWKIKSFVNLRAQDARSLMAWAHAKLKLPTVCQNWNVFSS